MVSGDTNDLDRLMVFCETASLHANLEARIFDMLAKMARLIEEIRRLLTDAKFTDRSDLNKLVHQSIELGVCIELLRAEGIITDEIWPEHDSA